MLPSLNLFFLKSLYPVLINWSFGQGPPWTRKTVQDENKTSKWAKWLEKLFVRDTIRAEDYHSEIITAFSMTISYPYLQFNNFLKLWWIQTKSLCSLCVLYFACKPSFEVVLRTGKTSSSSNCEKQHFNLFLSKSTSPCCSPTAEEWL